MKNSWRDRTYHLRVAAVAGAVAITALLLTGCAGTGLLDADLPDDGPPPVTSNAAARSFLEKGVAAGQIAGTSGRFTLTVTEEEVTSFLNIGVVLLQTFQDASLEDAEQLQDIRELQGVDELEKWQELLLQRENLPDLSRRRVRLRLLIEEPAVYFRGNGDVRGSGHVVVRGTVKFLVLELPARIVAAPRASEGDLVFDFVEGQLGPLPMPEVVFDLLGRGLSKALLAGKEYGEITEIRVTERVLTVSGRRNR